MIIEQMKIKKTDGVTTFSSINGNQFQFSCEKSFQEETNKKENHFTPFSSKIIATPSLESICGSGVNQYFV